MRRIAYLRWLAAVAAAFLFAGCGVLTKQELQPTPQTLTHGRFVYLADRTCRRDIRNTRRAFRRGPGNHEEYDKDLKALLNGYEQALFDLRGLAPPPSEAAEFRRLLASFNLEDLYGHHLLQAGDQGQAKRVHTLFKKLDATDKRLKSRAKALGLHACAQE
ncbi:MAG TPA: hypothetical protein VHZ77_04160 [Gaiellaceae bacterium]|jgi:hypothetical protein|nr:hypothetical protein [Gaiellaceae bacterium]